MQLFLVADSNYCEFTWDVYLSGLRQLEAEDPRELMAGHRGRQPALFLLGSFFPVLACLYSVNKFSSSYLNDGGVV